MSNPLFLRKTCFSNACVDFLSRIFKINPDERINFEEMCEHQFIEGMPSIKGIISLSGIQCLSDELKMLTVEDVLELAEVIQKVAESSLHPFLLFMKACISLKHYLAEERCKEKFKIVFDKAKN